MKNRGTQTFALNSLTVLVRTALAVMCGMSAVAMAADGEDDSVNAQVKPTSFIEIGAKSVSSDSNKFGEYNGLNQSGAYAVGNFGIKGGSAYDAYNGGDGKLRWEANGSDLGTTSRALDASISKQGDWSVGASYDELRHYTAEPFITPLQGSAGANSFTLPANFGAVNTTSPGTRGLTATQKSLMHTVDDMYSGRTNTGVNAMYRFNNAWSVDFEFNHLKQDGAKLIASGSNMQAAGSAGAASNSAVGEAVMMLMNPTSYRTDTVKFALNWTGEQGHLTAGYFGSFFRDDNNSLSWSNPFINGSTVTGTARAFPTDTLSTAPGNDFHQLNISGGYRFGSATKLAGGVSYGENTQNQGFLNDTALMSGSLPAASLDGKVVTTNANLKLTNSSIKDLTLSAGVKYNERDNQTQSNVYRFYDIGHATLRIIANAPYSNRKTQYELAGDYRLTKGQNIRVSYEREDIDRWCNNLANNPTGAPCVVVGSSSEDKLNARYRLKLDSGLSFSAGYAYSDRRADENHKAVTTIGVTTYGYINGGDAVGYKPYFDASRRQNMVKLGTSWDVTEKFSVTLDGRYSKDEYYDSQLGVHDGNSLAANLDASYNFSENSMLGAYASAQTMRRDMNVAATVNAVTGIGTNIWANRLSDRENVVGMYAKWGGLMGGKLAFKGDLSWSDGVMNYYTGSYPANAATCATSGTLTCGNTPNVKSTLTSFKLEGNYQLDKVSKIRLGYLYQNLKSNDYVYNIYQMGFTPASVMPSNQQAAHYSLNVVMASYIYSFQ